MAHDHKIIDYSTRFIVTSFTELDATCAKTSDAQSANISLEFFIYCLLFV